METLSGCAVFSAGSFEVLIVGHVVIVEVGLPWIQGSLFSWALLVSLNRKSFQASPLFIQTRMLWGSKRIQVPSHTHHHKHTYINCVRVQPLAPKPLQLGPSIISSVTLTPDSSSLKKTWQHSKTQDVRRADRTWKNTIYASMFISTSCPRYYKCISFSFGCRFKAFMSLLDHTQHLGLNRGLVIQSLWNIKGLLFLSRLHLNN